MKKKQKLLLIVLAILIVFGVGKNLIIKSAVQGGVKVVTGLKLSIRGFGLGISNTRVAIKDLKLYNPDSFQDKVMVDMPEIYVNYKLLPLLKKKIHVEELRINLKEFTVVKNASGAVNLDSLKVVQAQKEGKAPTAGEKKKAPDMQIDVMELKVGKVIYKDYSAGGEPSVKEFNVNLDERYTNITDPYAIVSIIVVKTLMHTTISNMVNLDVGGLATDAAKGIEEGAKKATEKATEGLKKILPFGKK